MGKYCIPDVSSVVEPDKPLAVAGQQLGTTTLNDVIKGSKLATAAQWATEVGGPWRWRRHAGVGLGARDPVSMHARGTRHSL